MDFQHNAWIKKKVPENVQRMAANGTFSFKRSRWSVSKGNVRNMLQRWLLHNLFCSKVLTWFLSEKEESRAADVQSALVCPGLMKQVVCILVYNQHIRRWCGFIMRPWNQTLPKWRPVSDSSSYSVPSCAGVTSSPVIPEKKASWGCDLIWCEKEATGGEPSRK